LKETQPNIPNLGAGALLEDHRNKMNTILNMLREHGIIGNI